MGLFGTTPHQQENKAWYNPTRYDLGVTELAAKLLGEKTDIRGGSDLSRDWANQTYTPPAPPPPANNPDAPKPDVRKILTNPIPNNTINSNIPSQPTPNSSTPNFPSMQEQINNIYNPLKASLDSSEQALGTQKTYLEGQSLQNRDKLTGLLNQQLTEGNQNFSDQQQSVFNANRSAMGEALNSYNAMQQNLMSRYGLGTGAGAMMSDILNQSKMQGDYKMAEGFQNAVSQIVNSQIKLKKTVDDEVLNTEKDYQSALKEIGLAFHAKVNDINLQRNTLESQKAQLWLDEMKQSQQRVQAIRDRKDEILFNIKTASDLANQKLDATTKTILADAMALQTNNKSNIENATTATATPTYGGTKPGISFLQDTLKPTPTVAEAQPEYWDVSNYFV